MRWTAEKKKGPDLDALKGNWHYSSALEYTYDTYYACHDGSDCCDNDMCRCAVLQDLKATSINPRAISDRIVGKMSNIVHAYCVDRIITKAVTPYVSHPEDLFDVHACGGYYGEEIGEIKMCPSVADEIAKKLRLLGEMKSNRERILYVLNNEYGHVLSAVEKAKSWYVKTVDFSEIDIGQPDHYNKLEDSVVAAYVDYDLPRAVCLKSGDKFRLIDGYHRVAAFEKKRKGDITIITNK